MVTPLYVYALILNYKSASDTIDCISCLLASDYENLKIIVVDNYSQDQSLEDIQHWLNKSNTLYETDGAIYNENDPTTNFDKKITLIQAKANKGFAEGNNIALKLLADIDGYVFLVNPDVNVSPDAISVLVKNVANWPIRSIVGCKMLNFKDKTLKYNGGVRLNPLTGTINEILDEEDADFDYICGGAIFFHSLTIKEVGLLPQIYFLYWEDADWCYQAKKMGYQLKSCNDSVVYDKGGTSIGRGFIAEYYYTRNSLIFHKKIGKQVLTIIASNLFLRLPKKILLMQPDRAKAVIAGTFDFILNKHIDAPKKNFDFS